MLAVIIIILFAVITFILLTDPYCLLGRYNVDKRLPYYTWAHYNFLKKYKKIDVGLVGSSAINYYSSTHFDKQNKDSFFMGVESSNIDEHLQYGRLLLEKKPQQLFFFYTFYSLNPSRANQLEFNKLMVTHNHLLLDVLIQYVHPRAFGDSIIFWYKKVFGWKRKYQLFQANGLRTQAHYLNRENFCFDKNIADYFAVMSIDPHYYASRAFQDSGSILKGITKIEEFTRDAKALGIQMYHVSTPLYRLTIALIYHLGLGETYENYRRQMAAIGPFVDLNLNMEFTSDPQNWWDSHHARRGDKVIEDIVNQKFVVDLSNVEETNIELRPTQDEFKKVRQILEEYDDWPRMEQLVSDRVKHNPPLVP